MNIIIGREPANELRDRFIVLELETISEPNQPELTAFCVVPAEKVKIQDVAQIEQYILLHEQLIKELNKSENPKFVLDAIDHLYGQFGGELDTFYDFLKEKLS